MVFSMMTFCEKNTPTMGLEVAMGNKPLHLYIREMALKTRLRTSSVVKSVWSGITIRKHRLGHIYSLDRELNAIAPEHVHNDITTKLLKCNVEIVLDGKILNSVNNLNIYTDGSKMEDGHTGSGFCITKGDQVLFQKSLYMGKKCSVYQAEVQAIIEACHVILSDDKFSASQLPDIHFFSDSRSAIQSLENDDSTSILIVRCKMLLNDLANQSSVTVNWVKGHDDCCGNEVADMLAKDGTTPYPIVEPVLPVTKKALHRAIEGHINSLWQDEWSSSVSSYNDTKSFIRVINTDKSFKKAVCTLDKESLHFYVAWITGHCSLNKHLVDIKSIEDPMCRKCHVERETPYNIFFECEPLEFRRFNMMSMHAKREEESLSDFKNRERKWDINYRRIDIGFLD
jgi:ribonuclease HI